MTTGSEIAGFRVLTDLGTGAASSLYLVQDPKSKQIWALKQVRKETEKDQRFLDQTETEYTVGTQLDHPNIRKVYRIIKNRRVIRVNEIILLLELVDGLPLDRQRPATFADAAEVFAQVSDALFYMHEKGFVHADMKPNNIIVTEGLTPKLIDLGQSCRIGTVKERIQGTIDYIAPEQVHRQAIMPATDVYNLGATMYWALTGQHIPTAMSARSGLGYAKEASQLERPTPPHELNPDTPQEFSDLIMECVEPDPKKRPTMESVRNRLQIIQIRLDPEMRIKVAAPADDEVEPDDA
ncbi:MAG: serine/threonine-protein kinase [Phycisphaerales bacterium]